MDPQPAPDASSGRRRLLRSTGVVGSMTLLSRILGLVHRNKAARQKSRLNARLKSLGQ